MKTHLAIGTAIAAIFLLFAHALSEEPDVPRHLRVRREALRQLTAPEKGATLRINASALRWTELFINAEFLPPKGAVYTFIHERTEDDVDMLRLKYMVDRDVFTLTQTFSLFALQIDRIDDEMLALQDIEELARKLFCMSAGLSLTIHQQEEKRWEGGAAAFGEDDDANDNHEQSGVWLQSLSWWQEPGRLGFAFGKTTGQPQAAVMGYDPILNQGWFSRGQKRASPRIEE